MKQTVPPMEFDKLRIVITDYEVQNAIDELLEKKRIADEKALITSVPVFNQWLSDTLDWCKERIPALPSEKKYPDELNNIFRKYIQP
jgi:predicted nucleotidyltransferase